MTGYAVGMLPFVPFVLAVLVIAVALLVVWNVRLHQRLLAEIVDQARAVTVILTRIAPADQPV